MGLKSPMASLRSLCSEYIHLHQHSDGGIRGRKRNIQPPNQCIDRNNRLTEQELGKAPYCSILADTAFLEAFAPLVGDNSQLAQKMHRVATRGHRAFEKQLDPVEPTQFHLHRE